MSERSRVVEFDPGRRRPDPALVREFAATARKLQREREGSVDLVERLLRDTPRAEWPRRAEDPALRNSGVLERLGKEVASRLERDPQEALSLSNLATSIAETLPHDSYPPVVMAQIKAHAWKDRGKALCYLARYENALDALSRAEAQLQAFGTLAHDRAIVRFVRATTLLESGRFDDARTILGECGGVFREYGDDRLYLFCGIAEALLLHRLGRFADTYTLLVKLLQLARSSGDRESEARIHNNLGSCAVELQRFDEANIHLSQALAMFTDLGWQIEAIRTGLASGRLLIRRGDDQAGLACLVNARRSFLDHGLVEEAGLCGLEMVEELLLHDQPRAAADLARQIVAEFMEAGLNERAISALAHLHESIESHRASPPTANYVRSYITGLRGDPERQFVATI